MLASSLLSSGGGSFVFCILERCESIFRLISEKGKSIRSHIMQNSPHLFSDNDMYLASQ